MPNKYKIILASETYPPDVNGAAIAVERLATMLSERESDILVIAPSTTRKEQWEQVNEHLRVYRIASVSLKPIHPYFRAVWKGGLHTKITKVVADFQPDIMHIHNHFLLGRTCVKVARKASVPIVGTNHFMPDNVTEYFPKILEKPVEHYMWKDFIRIYNQLDYVTAPTLVALKMIKDLGLNRPSRVISNGIDLKEFTKVPIKKSTYEAFNLRPDVPIFLFVGRLEQDKNIDVVLRAIALNKRNMNIQMVIAGKGKDGSAFQKLAKELHLEDRVFFVGKVSDEDLKQLYAIATVYVGSGTAELQGLAVMEAMANGLPVLAANAVALPELVYNGENGYLFEINPEDLAEKMQQILKDPVKLKAMGEKSLEHIARHDKENTASAFMELYERLMSS